MRRINWAIVIAVLALFLISTASYIYDKALFDELSYLQYQINGIKYDMSVLQRPHLLPKADFPQTGHYYFFK